LTQTENLDDDVDFIYRQ